MQLHVRPGRGAPFVIPVETEAILGRHPSSQVILYGEDVEFAHARLWCTSSEWWISDLSGRTGVKVGGRRIVDSERLKHGDLIEIAGNVIEVKLIHSSSVQAPVVREKIEQSQRVDYVRSRVFSEVSERIRKDLSLPVSTIRELLGLSIRQAHGLLNDQPLPAECQTLLVELERELIGLGPIEELLQDETVSEIMVNGATEIFFERAGEIHSYPKVFSSEAAIRAVVDRVLLPFARPLNDQIPFAQVKLADGSRLHVAVPPVSSKGTVITIRKFNRSFHSVDALINSGFLNSEVAEYLCQAMRDRRNIFISGPTGSGKTTLLSALLTLAATTDRILILEDQPELSIDGPQIIRLETSGNWGLRELLREALRMRPDRIVIGECRGAETGEMVQAMNTGHEGSLTTLHSNSPEDAIRRLTVLLSLSLKQFDALQLSQQLASALDILVQLGSPRTGGRRVTTIEEVRGLNGQTFIRNTIYSEPPKARVA